MRALKRSRFASLALCLVFVMSPASFIAVSQATTQNDTEALERGYRTGYSDGYLAGHGDATKRTTRDAQSKEEYVRGDRAYQSTYGSLEDYRDGYQQGFENGYAAGYDRRGFDSATPPNLARRSSAAISQTTGAPTSNGTTDDTRQNQTSSNSTVRDQTSAQQTTGQPDNSAQTASNSVLIPANTVLLVELMTNVTTDASIRGDRIQAQVMEPQEYQGAMLDGRVTRIRRPGKVRGPGEVEITFEQIRLTDNRFANINAQVIEVVAPGSAGVGDVDDEGGVRGERSRKGDAAKVGAGAGIGAAIGAIIGGGKGAAIGAVLGGVAGASDVATSRGKDVRMMRGQQLRVRTTTNTRIQ